MASAASLFIQIDANSSGFARALSDIENRVQGVGRGMQAVGQSISSAGAGLTAGVTAPLVLGAGAAVKAAVDYETAFTGVQKTVNATTAEFAALDEGIRGLATEIPVSAVELANIAESAGQLGIETGNILKFTETMAALGVATNLTSTEAATALARFSNIAGTPQQDIDRLGSTIVALGNNLATTEAEIVNMALRLAGAASTAGFSEDQILSLAGALSSVGIQAESGGTAFSRIIVDLANAVADGGDELQAFAEVAGVSADEFASSFQGDPAQALLSFINGLQDVQSAGGNVFAVLETLGLSDIRVRDSLLRAAGAGNLFAESLQLGSQAWQQNTALAKEANLFYGTTANQLQLLKNRLADVLITIGGPLIDALTAVLVAAEPFLLKIAEWAEAFAAMDPSTQRAIVAFGAVVAALGPILIVVGQVVTAIGGLITFFGAIAGAVGGFGGVIAGAGGAILAFLGPVGLAIAAIIAVVGALYLAWRNNWFGIRDITQSVISRIRSFVQPFFEWLNSLQLPRWLGGGVISRLAGGGGGQGGGDISPDTFQRAQQGTRAATAAAPVNNLSASVTVQGSVRSDEDLLAIETALTDALATASNQRTRYPIGGQF